MDEETTNSGPRIGPCHHAADALLKNAKINSAPIRIKSLLPQIKRDFTITFAGTKSLPDGVYALTHRDNGNIIIGYNQSVSVTRQKFSIAHELGHLYMGHLHSGAAIDLDSKANGEIEANQFAAQLLMPSKLLRADIKSGMKDPKQLAAHYEVSEEAIWWRLKETNMLSFL